MPTWPTQSLSAGFQYVQSEQPAEPVEGATWYDTSTGEAKVYDGATWHLLTVTAHAEVGDVQPGQHRSDANVRATVDGQVDADTVDGKHASELGAPGTTQSSSYTSAWTSFPSGGEVFAPISGVRVDYGDISMDGVTVTVSGDLIPTKEKTLYVSDNSGTLTFNYSPQFAGRISVSGQPQLSNRRVELVSLVPHSHNI